MRSLPWRLPYQQAWVGRRNGGLAASLELVMWVVPKPADSRAYGARRFAVQPRLGFHVLAREPPIRELRGRIPKGIIAGSELEALISSIFHHIHAYIRTLY
jgi:hypothetical protein